MKIAVIGCTHAGTAAVKNMALQYPEADITVYEKSNNVSFLSCGIALHVGGVVEDINGLFYSSPEELAELGVNMRMLHEVKNIDTENKTIDAINLETGEHIADQYDKLVMTTGSWPVVPNFEGIHLDNIILSKNFAHAKTVVEKAHSAQKITVIGAGYIGTELVEAFESFGKDVTFIDSADRILNRYLDEEFTDVIQNELTDRGIDLRLNEWVSRFTGENGRVTKVITDKAAYDTDLVILCIGFRPNTDLLKGKVDMLPNGAIKVDQYMTTSDPDIFAAGDSAAVYYNPVKQHAYIPLATNAVRMGTLVAKNIVNPTVRYMGTQGTSGLYMFGYNLASTGITEGAAPAFDMNVKSITIKDSYRPDFMPTNEDVLLKVVYEQQTGRIVGAQALSKTDVTQAINTMSVIIQNEMTIEELGYIDFFFHPHFNKPVHLLNQAGLQAAH